MTTQLYCTLTYDDGRPPINTKCIGDAAGVRVYAQQQGVRLLLALPGATIARRQSRNEDVIVLSGVDEPLGFALTHWPGCHCGSALKAFRAPSAWEQPA